MQLLILLLIFISSTCLAGSHYLCSDNEEVIFGCQAGKKIISICGSSQFTSTTGYVQYRFGTLSDIELKYPATSLPGRNLFWASNTMYSGGYETRIRFENNGISYIVYEAMYRTRFDGVSNDPEMTTGVSIKIKVKRTIHKMCTDEGGFRTPDYKKLDNEQFDYDLAP